jgi:hypothetical protein
MIIKNPPKDRAEYVDIKACVRTKNNFGKYHYEDLLPGNKYILRTDETGQKLEIKAEFLGWEKEPEIKTGAGKVMNEGDYSLIFKPLSNIKVDEAYTLGFEKI